VWRLIAFNVGIEIGQLTAIVGILAVAAVVSMLFKNRHDVALTKVAFAALFAVGSMTPPFLTLNEFRSVDGDASSVALPEDSGCTVGDRTERFPAAGGGHTEKTFYEPAETVPVEDFGHALGDGYIVVLYPEDQSNQDLDLLREYVTESQPAALLADAREDAGGQDAGGQDAGGQVAVITAKQRMTCESVHIGALRQLSRSWLASIGYDAYRPGPSPVQPERSSP